MNNYQEELRKIDELKRRLDFLRLEVELLQVINTQEKGTMLAGFTTELGRSASDLIEQRSKAVDDFRRMMLLAGP
jgi:hypothetical protein